MLRLGKCSVLYIPSQFYDCEADFNVLIIIGRPFLAMGRALVNIEMGHRKFKLNDEQDNLNIGQSIQ